MSLGTNLATRPFYNERTVRALLALSALILLGLTAFTVTRLTALTRRDQALGAQTTAAESRTRELKRDVARLRSGIDAKHVADISAATHEANLAIDQRTFSWTELFNRLEAALPPNVRLSAVRPVVDEEGRLTVKLTVLGRDVESVDQYLDALEKTGAFHDLLSRKEREDNKEGLIEANVEGRYAPQAAVVPVGAAR
jgi:Tfp pilus assembly protein PilN